MNDEDGAGGSSKSNSITSEHSLQSTGISASSQGSSTNSLPKGVPIPQGAGPGGGGVTQGLVGQPGHDSPAAMLAQSHDSYATPTGGHAHHLYSNTPTSFHRTSLAQAQGGPSPSLSAKSKLSQVSRDHFHGKVSHVKWKKIPFLDAYSNETKQHSFSNYYGIILEKPKCNARRRNFACKL